MRGIHSRLTASQALPHASLALVLLAISHGQPQYEVDNNSSKQSQCEDGRTEPIIEAALTPHPYALRAPVECEKSVDHSHHSNDGEETSADLANLIAEVKQTNGQATEDDGEVEP